MGLVAYDLRALLLKQEVTEMTDAAPAAATDAMQIINGTSQMEADKVVREIDRPAGGARPFLLTRKRAMIKGGFELVGASALGSAAPIGALLRCCGHAQTLTAATRADYTPILKNVPSASAYFFHGGMRKRALGCRGRITSIAAEINGYAKAEFELGGWVINNTPDQADVPNDTDYSNFPQPYACTTESLTVSINGVAVECVGFTLDPGVDFGMPVHSEGKTTRLRARSSTIKIRMYPAALATLDLYALANAESQVPMVIDITGSTIARQARIAADRVQWEFPQETEIDKDFGFEVTGTLNPSGAGNDDYLLRFGTLA